MHHFRHLVSLANEENVKNTSSMAIIVQHEKAIIINDHA